MMPMSDSEVDASAMRWYESMADEHVATSAEIERIIRADRGRWMMVNEDGQAFRYSSLSSARGNVVQHDRAGIRARVLRWRKDRVRYAPHRGCFEVVSDRWLP